MKQIYKDVIPATYHYLTTNYNGTYNRCKADVDVLGESDKSYLIRLRYPVRDRLVGDEIWVRKKSIQISAPIDTTDYWFNKQL